MLSQCNYFVYNKISITERNCNIHLPFNCLDLLTIYNRIIKFSAKIKCESRLPSRNFGLAIQIKTGPTWVCCLGQHLAFNLRNMTFWTLNVSGNMGLVCLTGWSRVLFAKKVYLNELNFLGLRGIFISVCWAWKDSQCDPVTIL